MSAISSPALALASAFDRFERSGARAVAAASGDERYDLATEMVDQIEAVAEVKANVALVRFADEMWNALLDVRAGR